MRIKASSASKCISFLILILERQQHCVFTRRTQEERVGSTQTVLEKERVLVL